MNLYFLRRTSLLVVLLASVAFFGRDAKAELPFASGERVLFLGDSITQDGRYVALLEAYLWSQYPDRDIDIVNAGLSSETVSGITEPIHPFPRPNVHDRLTRAMDLVEPDWLVVCYGMNDGIYHPSEPRIVDAYRAGLTKLVDDVTSRGTGVILLTPPSFDVDAKTVQANLKQAPDDEPYGYRKPFKDYDKTLVALSEVVMSLDSYPGVEMVIDVHAATDRYLHQVKSVSSDYQYGDGVHPPLDGHLAIACAVLQGIGCEAQDPQTVLTRLTGIAPPIGEVMTPSAKQNVFREAIFSRSMDRSSAYREVIRDATQSDIHLQAIIHADEIAATRAASLRAELSTDPSNRATDDSVLEPYRAKAEEKWHDEIELLEKLDETEEHSDDSILFIGSSSIRLWDKIAEQMSPYAVIKRGYGGAKYSDLAVFAKRLITPHRYRAMVVFVGNDVSGKSDDHSPDEVERLARHVCATSRRHQPDAPVFLVEVTPTPLRFKTWRKIRDVNTRLRDIALTTPNTFFIATAEYYLDAKKRPRKELFREDRLHQNEDGYTQWSGLIKARLNEVLGE